MKEYLAKNAPKLGFGLMRLPMQGDVVDHDELCRMVDLFMEKGFTYFDTAWMYCGFQSETAIREALVKRYPRESFTLADKLHAGFMDCKEDRDRIFNEQLRKTGVEYFDYYLLHDVGGERYDLLTEWDCFNWLVEKKKAGLVKTIGFSCHDDAEFVEKILSEHPEMEFVQLQVNYLDWESQGVQARKSCEVAAKYGKPVIVMEPVRGGTLAKLPPEAEAKMKAYAPDASIPSWAIRFAASKPQVWMVLSGMSNVAQMEDNLSYMQDFVPLNDTEEAIIRDAVELINASIAIPCTGCAYCVEGCPMQIAIPQYFSLYNLDLQESDDKGWKPQEEYYERIAARRGKASDCIGCGACEAVCPQHLPIITHLKTVAEYFEG
ncbi:MAG: aldo/keto reductase [Clostridia bacterium]|nr:aldo/keto reductase [Clostridia bacterium]